MERLTYVTKDGEILFHPEDLPEDDGMTIRQLAIHGRWEELNQIAEKLVDMEQKEEHGILVRLPCKVGDTVYELNYRPLCNYVCKVWKKWKCEEHIPCEYEKKVYYVKKAKFGLSMLDSIGKTVFRTLKEAEKKLEEMKKNDGESGNKRK